MTELLTRRRADWSPYEHSKLLEYKNDGMNNFQISQKLRRSETAIRMQLDKLLTPIPPKIQEPIYNTPKPILQQIHTNFQTETTTNYRIEQFDKPGDYMTARLQEEDNRNKNNAPMKFFGWF